MQISELPRLVKLVLREVPFKIGFNQILHVLLELCDWGRMPPPELEQGPKLHDLLLHEYDVQLLLRVQDLKLTLCICHVPQESFDEFGTQLRCQILVRKGLADLRAALFAPLGRD